MSVSDASNWRQLQITNPSNRIQSSWAPQPDGTAVMYGPRGGGDIDPFAPDDLRTWVFDGTWTAHTPATSPTTDGGYHSMAYDPVTDKVILWGGISSVSGDINETWSWNGTTWTQLSPATSPNATHFSYMVTVADGVILLKKSSTFGSSTQVWKWNGTDWTLLSTNAFSSSAPEIEETAQAFNGTNIVVLQRFFTTPPADKTWSLNVSTGAWTLLATNSLGATDVSASEPSMVWTGDRFVALLAGEPYESGPDAYTMHTWKYESGAWTELAPTTEPTGPSSGYNESVQHHLMMYDGSRVFAYDAERSLTWVYGDFAGVYTGPVRLG